MIIKVKIRKVIEGEMMSLSSEAGYLYVYSKELVTINKKIKKLSKHADKHLKKHHKTDNINKKKKHYDKHKKKKEDIHDLIKKHNKVLKHLKHHNVAFYHALKKESKIE